MSFFRERDLGAVLHAPIDIRLASDTVLIPDIIFVSKDRLHIIDSRAVNGAPDLVVEILSGVLIDETSTRSEHCMPGSMCRSIGLSTRMRGP